MPDKLKKVTVKGAGDDSKVVLWEKSEQHPNGEAFVPNDGRSYTVAETARVRRLISEGLLVEGDATEVRERNAERQNATLRRATTQEQDAANLNTRTERETAVVREKRNA